MHFYKFHPNLFMNLLSQMLLIFLSDRSLLEKNALWKVQLQQQQ